MIQARKGKGKGDIKRVKHSTTKDDTTALLDRGHFHATPAAAIGRTGDFPCFRHFPCGHSTFFRDKIFKLAK